MTKWVRKAESLGITHAAARQQFGASALPSVMEESARSLDDLQFVIGHTAFSGALTADAVGLALAEDFCRDNTAWMERKDAFPDDAVDRLIALFVGHVFEQTQRGEWVVYPGKYHVYNPIVVELRQTPGHYIQPFLFCKELRTKMNLRGARSGKSLTLLYENPLKSATP